MTCELRFHGESYGWEVQFIEARGHEFVARGRFLMRGLAVSRAERERDAMSKLKPERVRRAGGDDILAARRAATGAPFATCRRYDVRLLRVMRANPIRPELRRRTLAGSGTGAVAAAIVLTSPVFPRFVRWPVVGSI